MDSQNTQRATRPGQFTWLHLTDLHVGLSLGAPLWPNVEEEMLSDLERVVARIGPIDVIFFTGDLTQTGAKSEFQEFTKILATLRAKLEKLGRQPLFLAVPGNHDLVRPDKDGAVVRALQEWSQDSRLREQFWTRPDCDYRKTVEAAFTNWNQWAVDTLDWHAFEDVKRNGLLPGDFAATWSRDGVRIGIVGLNTAALQLANGDYRGRLSLHASQVSRLMEKLYVWLESHDACFLLTHHDPSWLDREGNAMLNGELAKPGRFAVHLCGHRHAQVRTLIREGGAAPRRINIGRSLFGIETYEEEGNRRERLHGYSVGTLRINGKRLMRLWPRRDELKQAGHRALGPDASDELEGDGGTQPEDLGPTTRKEASVPVGSIDRDAAGTAAEKATSTSSHHAVHRDASSEKPASRVDGGSGVLPEKQNDGARLPPVRADELRKQVARNDLKAVLTALQLVASHQRDKELRRFALEKLGELSSLEIDFADRKLSSIERRAELGVLRRVLLEKIDHHEHYKLAGGEQLEQSKAERSPTRSNNPGMHSAVHTPVLQCIGLMKDFGQFRLHPVDFCLEHGQIAAVIGPNGAGKTTLLRMLARELHPSNGEVKIGDRNDQGEPLDHPVAFVPQIPETWNGTLLSHLRRRAAFLGRNTEDRNTPVIEDAAQLLELWDRLDSPCSALSAGYRMRAAIAGAMVANPGVLILDEPLAPLDPASQQRLLRELNTRARHMGTAIVVASQHIAEIESLADEVLMLIGGRAKRLTRDAPLGRVFELRTKRRNDDLVKRVEQFQETGEVEAYVIGMSTIQVRFAAPQSLASVLARLADVGVTGVFDISNSGLAEHHSPLLSGQGTTDER